MNARRAAGLTLAAIVTLAVASMVLERVPPRFFEDRSQPIQEQVPSEENPRYFGMDPVELYEIYEYELARLEEAQNKEDNEETTDTAESEQEAGLSRSTPTQLRIPKLEIDMEIAASDGEADVAAILDEAADGSVSWYEAGPSPGELGSSILVGRAAAKDDEDKKSALVGLRKIRLGNEIEIDREDGEAIRFVVDNVRTCPAVGTESVIDAAPSDNAHLLLVTCGNDDDSTDGVMILATLVEEQEESSTDEKDEKDQKDEDDGKEEEGSGEQAESEAG